LCRRFRARFLACRTLFAGFILSLLLGVGLGHGIDECLLHVREGLMGRRGRINQAVQRGDARVGGRQVGARALANCRQDGRELIAAEQKDPV
jgi:hypothetical protein